MKVYEVVFEIVAVVVVVVAVIFSIILLNIGKRDIGLKLFKSCVEPPL